MRMEGLTSLVIGGGGAGIRRATTAAYAEHGAAGAIRTAVSAAFQPDDEVDEVPLGRYGTVADLLTLTRESHQ